MSDTFFYEQHHSPLRVTIGHELNFFAHLHRQIEFVVMLDGLQQMTIDGKTRLLHAGEAAMALPNRVHSFSAPQSSRYLLGIVDLSCAGEYASTLISCGCDQPFLSAEQVHPDVRLCCERLAGEALDPPLSRAYLSVILGRLTAALPLTPNVQPAGQDITHCLLTYIAEHIAEPLSLDILARRLYINKYSISRVFSEQIGCGLRTYVNALRVELAQNLLHNPSISTPELIAKCGFESERTYYRTFREHCGMTPRQYRTMLGSSSSQPF